jgi:mutator protein MutT
MPHLWEFPGHTVNGNEPLEESLKRLLQKELGATVRIIKKLGKTRHAYTRYRAQIHAYICQLNPPGQKIMMRSAIEGRWISRANLDKYAFSSANRRIVKMLEKEPENRLIS